jgi:hypothetical protein
VQGPDEPLDHDPAGIARRFAPLVAACALVTAAGASAQGRGQIVALPSPFVPLRPSPPLPASTAVTATETRFPGRLASSQAVEVFLDRSGEPFRVVDVDRILIARKGDYSFALAGPIQSVRAARGSGAQPGLRRGAVVWQGFSPGRRVLPAVITLSPKATRSSLPLRVEVDDSGLRLVNTTSANVKTVDASLSAVAVARVLDAARAGLVTGTPVPAPLVTAQGPVRNVSVDASVPLHLRGTVRFGRGSVRRVAAVLGRKPLRLDGAGKLTAVDLSVSVPAPATMLRPPGSRRWTSLALSGRLRSGRGITALAVERLLAAALATQFHEFLANPDAGGASQTSYHYELARRAQAVPPAQRRDGNGWAVPLAVGLGLAVAAAAGPVLWAHS